MKVLIFGREPAVLSGVVEALLALLLSLNLFGLTPNDISLWMAGVTAALGLYTAYVTKQTVLGGAVGFAKAVLILAVAYGLPLNENQTIAVISFVTVTLGFVLRPQTGVVVSPNFNPNPDAPENRLIRAA